jgi:hypothetical protein
MLDVIVVCDDGEEGGERNTSQRWAAAAADLGNILPREID